MKSTIVHSAVIIAVILNLGCASMHKVFTEESDSYDFRNSRWGYSKERVELNERGNTAFLRTRDTLIYKSKVNQVPMLVVYNFKDNQLRSAGYITQKPVLNAKSFFEESIKIFGVSTSELSDGMMWSTPRSIVYVNGYATITLENSTYGWTHGGVLEPILKEPNQKKGGLKRWDGVLTYIDRVFYAELQETDTPLLYLSFHEKVLFGIVKKREVTLSGMGTADLTPTFKLKPDTEEKPNWQTASDYDNPLAKNGFDNPLAKEPVLPKSNVVLDRDLLTFKSGDNWVISPSNPCKEWVGSGATVREKTIDGLYHQLDFKSSDTSAVEWKLLERYKSPIQFEKSFEHWIISHAKSKIVYDVSHKDYTKFSGYVALSNIWPADSPGCGHSGTVSFQFKVDDDIMFSTPTIVGVKQSAPIHVEFDMPVNAKTLIILVTDGGDGTACDHWTLGNASLLRK
jgi:hypothetical protein